MPVYWCCSISSFYGWRNLKLFHLKKLDLGDLEAQFGMMVREKENHNNYVLFRFDDLEKISQYYENFKTKTRVEIKSKETKLTEDQLRYEISLWKEKISKVKSNASRKFYQNRIRKLEEKLEKFGEDEVD